MSTADSPPDPAASPPPSRESLAEVMARWKAHIEPLRDVPREVRVPIAKQFFATISWESLEYLCHEGSRGVGADSTGILAQIMTYRAQALPPTTAQAATMVATPDYVIECRSPLVAWVTVHRDSLAPADRVQLASAFRTAANYPGLPIAYLDQLLTGMASLIASDSLMAGMMGWGRAADPDTAGLAVRMLSHSADPRAADSLAMLALEYRRTRSPLIDLSLVHCRGRCAELALPTFIAVFEDSTGTPEHMVKGLEAAATVPTLPAAQAILARYRDGGVIADSTFNAAQSSRGFYYGLWLATRVAEPHLTDWLQKGPEPEAKVALELFDRSFRFGPADHDSLVSASLAAYAGRSDGTVAARAKRVYERSLDPPQSKRPPPVPAAVRPDSARRREP